jgi:nicotinic acid mononucleotide adenylyltransferase
MEKVVLVLTGSLNPPTMMHLRMFGEFVLGFGVSPLCVDNHISNGSQS